MRNQSSGQGDQSVHKHPLPLDAAIPSSSLSVEQDQDSKPVLLPYSSSSPPLAQGQFNSVSAATSNGIGSPSQGIPRPPNQAEFDALLAFASSGQFAHANAYSQSAATPAQSNGHFTPLQVQKLSPAPVGLRNESESREVTPETAHAAKAESPSSVVASANGTAVDFPLASYAGSSLRLPPILQVEKQHVTTSATQAASASRRRNDALFKCPVPGCNSTFTRRFNLRGHLRSHTEERPFVCEWPGCGKGFARSHDCKRHTALHTAKQGTHVCAGCQKQFSRTDALNRHLKSDGGANCRKAIAVAGHRANGIAPRPLVGEGPSTSFAAIAVPSQ